MSPRTGRRRVPQAAVLLLAVLLAAAVIYITWPSRTVVLCERLPELLSLAVLAAALFVLSFRSLLAPGAQDRRTPGGAAILAALSLFLAAHFVAEYRKPCLTVRQQFTPGSAPR